MSPPLLVITWKQLPYEDNGDVNMIFECLYGGEFEFDHIIPVSRGGSLELDNVQALCHDCHRIKTSMEVTYTESKKYSIHKFADKIRCMP